MIGSFIDKIKSGWIHKNDTMGVSCDAKNWNI